MQTTSQIRAALPTMEVLESRELLSVTADLDVNQSSGVGPLAVHFDASGTTSTATTNPLHELDFAWDFGDESAGQWDLFDTDKNEAYGPIAGHVYDEPGTYYATLTVTDSEGSTDTDSVTIQVQDPDTVFSGTDTICFSTSGTFTDAPSGSQQVTTSSFATVMGYAASGKRLLLARGETWTNSSAQTLNVAGEGILGAFGTGDKPVISSTSGVLRLSYRTPVLEDWRIMDLDLDGADTGSAIYTDGTADEVLIYRVDIEDFDRGISAGTSILDYWNNNSYPGHTLYDGLSIVECTVDHCQGGSSRDGMYVAGQRAMLLGNSITDGDEAGHALNANWLQKAVLSNNYVGISNSSKHQFKLAAPTWGSAGLGYNEYTEQVVLTDNVFQGGANAWSVAVGPSSSSSDQRVRDVIADSNLFRSGNSTSINMLAWAQDVTVRNNVFDTDDGNNAFRVDVRGVEPAADDVSVLNNTFYASDTFTAVSIGSSVTDTTVQNNLQAPSGTMISGSGTGLVSSNNLSTSSPGFVDATPSDREDFALDDESAAVDYGTTVDVFRDMFAGVRPQQEGYDAGAYELPTQIEIDLDVNRTSGVGPLAVHFDASGTTATATGNSFHELDFEWDFGDAGCGQWSLFGTEKDEAYGPIAGHVYEDPGTYYATLTVTDENGSYATDTVTIQVQDPDTVFSGTDTICFSTSGTFTGAPSGSLQVTTSDFATVMGYAASGKRLLLARGETWTNSSAQMLNVAGEGIIGAFGTGAKPVISSSSGVLRLSYRTHLLEDWRIMDLDLNGPGGGTGSALFTDGTADDVLILRVDIEDFKRGIYSAVSILDYWNNNSYPGHTLYDGLSIVECTIDHCEGGGGNNGMYVSGQRMMMLGNSITDCDEVEHTVRVPWMKKGVMSNNYFGISGTDKHQLKLHAPVWDDEDILGYNEYTEQIVISDNVFQAGTNGWSVTPGPEDTSRDERVRDLIFEGNLFRSGSNMQANLVIWAHDVTVRNNVFDTDDGNTCVYVSVRGEEPPSDDVSILNNTFYGTDSFSAVSITASVTDTTVMNNLQAPSGTMISGSGTGLVSSNNLSTSSPDFVSATPSDRDDFALDDESPAIDYGTLVPVFRDVFTDERYSGEAYDAGADEFEE
jgi:uncharacterized protein affecting Mg2+/Co2+ transport